MKAKRGARARDSLSADAAELLKSVKALDAAQVRGLRKSAPRMAFDEQPFDRLLLLKSPLYRKSRERYLKLKGALGKPGFLSTPRSLSSATLLETPIHYSAIETEYLWIARGGSGLERQATLVNSLVSLRACVTSVFHEQSHRILWDALPPIPTEAAAARRYLNFAESMVIGMDMALSDELGPDLARPLHRCGVIYDLGTTLKVDGISKRQYRNYLHAAIDATYLILELYHPRKIEKAITWLYPAMPYLARRAAIRANTLEGTFVAKTNPIWQKKHLPQVIRTLKGPQPLSLSEDPLDHGKQYLFSESWLEMWGL